MQRLKALAHGRRWTQALMTDDTPSLLLLLLLLCFVGRW
jgi:hypothetical protein